MADNSAFTTTTPSNTSSAGLGDDEFRSIKSQMLAFWQEEHYLLDGSASSAGEHKVGSARAYVGTSSQLSNPRQGAVFFNTTNRGIYVAESGSTFSKYLATDLYAATDSLNTWTAQQDFRSASTTSFVIGVAAEADSAARFAMRAFGLMEWGDGTNPRDVSLYRSAANLLKSDDTLQVVNLVVDSSISVPNAALEVNSLTVGGGTAVAKILSGTTIITGDETITTGDTQVYVVTVSGVTSGDVITVGSTFSTNPLNVSGAVNKHVADQVRVLIHNPHGFSVTVPAQTLRVQATRF